ncbi:DNA-directed RNA polymerase subunit beta' [Bienertia sinuspersici]
MDDNVRRASIIIALEEMRRSIEDLVARSPKPRLKKGNQEESKEKVVLNTDMFVALINMMVERNILSDGRYVEVSEQLGICLFKHSQSTICLYFHEVLDALIALSFDIIRPHHDLAKMSAEVVNSSKYWPYFKVLHSITPRELKLAAFSFDRIYKFLNVGWEGSAYDVTVWKDSLTQAKYGFPHPLEEVQLITCRDILSGRLGISKYCWNFSSIFEPGVRFQVPEFKNVPPQGIKEHFNFLQSSLRMKIVCSFHN